MGRGGGRRQGRKRDDCISIWAIAGVTSLAVRLLVLAAALLIDRVVGETPFAWLRVPHPVALMGRLVDFLDSRLNDPVLSADARRSRGIVATIALVTLGIAVGLALQVIVSAVPFGIVLEAVIVSILLAQKSLIDHVVAVGRALVSGGPESARRAVAQIVGRDVSSLGESGIARAAMESGAENFSDGVVAPLFWFVVLGLPGLVVYKLANTADSMIGHRTEKHQAFGWSVARLDDALSFIPARLSALLVAAAAAICACDSRRAAQAAWRDARRHKSPNAGWPEAALAGALGVAFGGPRRYGEIEVDGAWLNAEGRRDVGAADILAAVRLIDAAWALIVVLLALAAIILLALAR
jgi:adenosylcobinamide-phosphate synthase